MTDIKKQNYVTIKFCYVFRNYFYILNQSVEHNTRYVPIYFTLWNRECLSKVF